MQSGTLTPFLDSNLLSASSADSKLASFIAGSATESLNPELPVAASLLAQIPQNQTARAPHAAPLLSSHLLSNRSSPALVPLLATLAGRITADLAQNPERILSLNQSRRESIRNWILMKSREGQTSRPHKAGQTETTAKDELQQWIHQTAQTPERQALNLFFEEVAWITLGQALILKSWSDRDVRKWSETDLGRMNWALSSALKPHVPLDREGWQITNRNLYSWYTPDVNLQAEIWRTFQSFSLIEENPEMLRDLLNFRSDRGIDPRFFASLFQQGMLWAREAAGSRMSETGFRVFCPTLRDASMTRLTPAEFRWIGFEKDPYLSLTGELMELWWGPKAPPLWTQGTGLEAFPREQLALELTSPKPSVVQRIAELESCEFALIQDDPILRVGAKTMEAQVLRQQLDQAPFFKKLKGPKTPLDLLQACVSLTKLRPGGVLYWLRSEPLTVEDGLEPLRFLLDKGILLGHWDFTRLETAFQLSNPIFPKHLYAFRRTLDMKVRTEHRPAIIRMTGQIRSHIEVPSLLSEVFLAPESSDAVKTIQKGSCHILSERSSMAQKEWAERWPKPAEAQTLEKLDLLRERSVPLASLASIRALGGPAAPVTSAASFLSFEVAPKPALVLEYSNETERLETRIVRHHELARDPHKKGSQTEFLVVPENAVALTILETYLKGDLIRAWVTHFAEMRNQKRVLSESLLKFLPVLTPLATLIHSPHKLSGDALVDTLFTQSMTGEAVSAFLSRAKHMGPTEREPILALALGRAVTERAELLDKRKPLETMVRADGSIIWKNIFQILSEKELIPVTFHPEVKIQGNLMRDLPIGRFDLVQRPEPGILFSHDSGRTLLLSCDRPRLTEMVLSQLEGIQHPTWGELAPYLRLPKKAETAEAAANDILLAHSELSSKVRLLESLRDQALASLAC